MLFLLFKIGNERYVLEASRIVEIVPLLALKALPQATKGVAGIINYRGHPVPTIDLCQLASDRPASECLSTRIIILKYRDSNESYRLVGLIAEHATQTLRKDPAEFIDPGFRSAKAPYLGPLVLDTQGAIQWIKAEHLLPQEFKQLVFSDQAPLAHEGNPTAAA